MNLVEDGGQETRELWASTSSSPGIGAGKPGIQVNIHVPERSNPGRAFIHGPGGRSPRRGRGGCGSKESGPTPKTAGPARDRGIPGRNAPRAPQVPGSAPAALIREPGAISTTCQPLVETDILIRETAGYIEDAQRLADEENP